jgi:S-adenosylmethionine:tRNA ribosyltransferase-isomerase
LEASEIYNLEMYDYEVPQELIAQCPADERDKSRLLVIDQKGRIEHSIFSDIGTYLRPGDVLVLNDSKVIPARLKAIKEDTGGKVDILLIKEIDEGKWEVLLNKNLKPYQRVSIGKGRLIGHFISEDGRKLIQFQGVGVSRMIKELGLPALPPYIKRKDSDIIDRKRYQTVYAKKEGSLAAPTAGLHFTDLLLSKLREIGVIIAKVTLHIGPATFSPVRVEDIRDHQMGTEFYDVPPETAGLINRAKAEGRRIVAVGTTTTRALESASDKKGRIIPSQGITDLFVYPGYRFKVIDALITNFHLPRSTLLMLVSALAGIERIRYAYKEAIEKGYRFYSYGDAMLIFSQKDV